MWCSRETGESEYGESGAGPPRGLSASPLLKRNIFRAGLLFKHQLHPLVGNSSHAQACSSIFGCRHIFIAYQCPDVELEGGNLFPMNGWCSSQPGGDVQPSMSRTLSSCKLHIWASMSKEIKPALMSKEIKPALMSKEIKPAARVEIRKHSSHRTGCGYEDVHHALTIWQVPAIMHRMPSQCRQSACFINISSKTADSWTYVEAALDAALRACMGHVPEVSGNPGLAAVPRIVPRI